MNDQHKNNATITAKSGKRFSLSLHYNGSNNYLYVEAVKMYQFTAKYTEYKALSIMFR